MGWAFCTEWKKSVRIFVGKHLATRPHKYGCEVDETGSGSGPLAGCGISSVEPLGSATSKATEIIHLCLRTSHGLRINCLKFFSLLFVAWWTVK